MAITIGKAIKIIREAKRKSLGVLANQAGVSTPYLSLVEADKRNPSLDVIQRISLALEIPPDVFLLVGTGANSSLKSSNDSASRLMAMLNQMEDFERKIQDAVQAQGC
ncbi:MAG: helix-turn-helix transcriptional regulator [Phycisphaerae bacterium]|nr:helix-turn-helix transcriptional regulator [Phycisphaerae bacterium]